MPVNYILLPIDRAYYFVIYYVVINYVVVDYGIFKIIKITNIIDGVIIIRKN